MPDGLTDYFIRMNECPNLFSDEPQIIPMDGRNYMVNLFVVALI